MSIKYNNFSENYKKILELFDPKEYFRIGDINTKGEANISNIKISNTKSKKPGLILLDNIYTKKSININDNSIEANLTGIFLNNLIANNIKLSNLQLKNIPNSNQDEESFNLIEKKINFNELEKLSKFGFHGTIKVNKMKVNGDANFDLRQYKKNIIIFFKSSNIKGKTNFIINKNTNIFIIAFDSNLTININFKDDCPKITCPEVEEITCPEVKKVTCPKVKKVKCPKEKSNNLLYLLIVILLLATITSTTLYFLKE